MSYFGDRTPHQELLDSVEYVQHRFNLTDEELVVLLLKVLSAVADPVDSKSDELLKRKEAV
jgi:hypothetical protein